MALGDIARTIVMRRGAIVLRLAHALSTCEIPPQSERNRIRTHHSSSRIGSSELPHVLQINAIVLANGASRARSVRSIALNKRRQWLCMIKFIRHPATRADM